MNERGHWLGEDIDLWQLVVKIRRQWAALYGGDMTRRGINEISRLCWRPNTSMLAPNTSTQLGVLFAALLLWKIIGLVILIECGFVKIRRTQGDPGTPEPLE